MMNRGQAPVATVRSRGSFVCDVARLFLRNTSYGGGDAERGEWDGRFWTGQWECINVEGI